MPKPTKGARLGGSPAHERIILANLASQLFAHGRIVTTEAKAKRLRPLAEKLITKAKRGDLHARRTVLTTVRDKGVVHTLFTEIAPGFAERSGGYTRITKVGPRKGDNAPMAVIELVREAVTAKKAAPARTSTGAASGAVAASAAPVAEAAPRAEDGGELPAGTPPAEDLPDAEPVSPDTTAAPAEELVAAPAQEQATPSEESPSDDIEAEEAGATPGVTEEAAAPNATEDDTRG